MANCRKKSCKSPCERFADSNRLADSNIFADDVPMNIIKASSPGKSCGEGASYCCPSYAVCPLGRGSTFRPASPVANSSETTETAARLNQLLESLRKAGIIEA